MMRLVLLMVSVFVGSGSFAQVRDNTPSPFPDDPELFGDYRDIDSYVTRRYAYLKQVLRQQFTASPGRSKERYLEIDGAEQPFLLDPARLLEAFSFGVTADPASLGPSENLLLARGFPRDELSTLKTAMGAQSLSQVKKRAMKPVFDRYRSVMDPFHEADNGELAAYITAYLEVKWRVHEEWAHWYLSRLSDHALGVLLSFLYEKPTIHRYVDWETPPPAYIDYVRETKQRNARKARWAPDDSEPFEATVEPPRLVFDGSGHLEWFSVKGVERRSGDFFLTGDQLKDVYPEPACRRIARWVRAFEERNAVEKGSSAPCHREIVQPATQFIDPEPLLRNTVPDLSSVFVAEIEAVTPGFFKGRSTTLLTLRVEKWIRPPLSGVRDRYYLTYERGTIEIDGWRLCVTSTRHFFKPAIGTRLLALIEFGPHVKREGVFATDPFNLIVEGKNGSLVMPDFRKRDADLRDLSFAELVSHMEDLVEEYPFQINVIEELAL